MPKNKLGKNDDIFLNNLVFELVEHEPTLEELAVAELFLEEVGRGKGNEESKKYPVGEFLGSDAKDIYFRDMRKTNLLTKEGEITLSKQVALGGIAAMQARNILIESNLRLVVSIAKKYTNNGIPLLDLVQDGNMGLVKAAERFSHEKQCRFSTYAVWWIRQNIEISISNVGHTIRIPVHRLRLVNRYRKFAGKYKHDNGFYPDEETVLAEIKISRKQLLQIMEDQKLLSKQSLQDEVGGSESDGEASRSDFIADSSSLHFEFLGDDRTKRKIIYRAFKKLSKETQMVLRCRIGRRFTKKKTEEECKMTSREIERHEKTGIEKLKRLLLKNYDDLMG